MKPPDPFHQSIGTYTLATTLPEQQNDPSTSLSGTGFSLTLIGLVLGALVPRLELLVLIQQLAGSIHTSEPNPLTKTLES